VDSIARLAEAASTEPHGDFATRWPGLPKTPNFDAREPATINNNDAKGGQEEMPLIWPVLTDAERAELSDSAPKSVLMPAFLASALTIVLLFAGAVFKLARRRAQSCG
jgi:hypothetical protein